MSINIDTKNKLPIIYKNKFIRINPNSFELESTSFGSEWNIIKTNLPKLKYKSLVIIDNYLFIINEYDYLYAYTTDITHWEILYEKSIFDENVRHPWKTVYNLNNLQLLGINNYPIVYAIGPDIKNYRYKFTYGPHPQYQHIIESVYGHKYNIQTIEKLLLGSQIILKK